MTGDGLHPSLDDLAELDADGTVDAEVRSHAAECPECRSALDALRSVRRDLADLPASAMPSDVAERVDAALAQEASKSAGQGNVVPLATAERARLGSRRRGGIFAGGVAAGVVAALVVALFLGAFGKTHHKTQTAGAASRQSLSEGATAIVRETGTNYTPKNLGTTVNQLLLQPTTFAGNGAQGTAGGTTTGKSGSGPAGSPGSTHAPSVPEPSRPLANDELAVPAPLAALASSPAAMSKCLDTLLTGAPVTAPLAVDVARFNGKPAAVFVFPGTDPGHVQVYVVPPDGCTTGIFSFYNVKR